MYSGTTLVCICVCGELMKNKFRLWPAQREREFLFWWPNIQFGSIIQCAPFWSIINSSYIKSLCIRYSRWNTSSLLITHSSIKVHQNKLPTASSDSINLRNLKSNCGNCNLIEEKSVLFTLRKVFGNYSIDALTLLTYLFE